MKEKFLTALFIISSLWIPVFVTATTADDIRAQIQALLSQISTLQQQLSAVTTDTPTTVTPPSSSCPNLYRTLSRGSRGSDVTSLQWFLVAEGLLSNDSVTGFFGRATEAAVQQWQVQHAVVSSGTTASTGYGMVGARTRAAIMNSCGAVQPPITQCPKVLPEPCSPGTTLTWDIDTDGCRIKHRCIINPVSCPIYNACPPGEKTMTSQDANGCTIVQCFSRSLSCPIYNACPSGETTTTSRDANGCTIVQCFRSPVSTTQPSIQLLSPYGGEEFVSGSAIVAKWSTSGLPSDIAQRHPRLSFSLSDFSSQGNYGAYTVNHKQSNGVTFGETITDVSTILGGSASIPATLIHTSPNKFARGFLRVDLSYDRPLTGQQAASAILALSPMSSFIETGGTTQSEITISFPTTSTQNACFDDYQSWNLGGTWFADGQRRSSTCLVGGPGSGTVDFNCQRPNVCTNGQWR